MASWAARKSSAPAVAVILSVLCFGSCGRQTIVDPEKAKQQALAANFVDIDRRIEGGNVHDISRLSRALSEAATPSSIDRLEKIAHIQSVPAQLSVLEDSKRISKRDQARILKILGNSVDSEIQRETSKRLTELESQF